MNKKTVVLPCDMSLQHFNSDRWARYVKKGTELTVVSEGPRAGVLNDGEKNLRVPLDVWKTL